MNTMENAWIERIDADQSLIAALKNNVAEKERILFAVIEENEVLKGVNREMLEALEGVLETLETSNRLHESKCSRKISFAYIKEIETLIKKAKGDI